MSAYRALRQFVLNAAIVAMGSPDTFAALVTSGRFGKQRRSLRRA
jgi:hypothetical protein